LGGKKKTFSELERPMLVAKMEVNFNRTREEDVDESSHG